MRVFVKFDGEREAWVVMVNDTEAIIFVGEGAQERAAGSARDIRAQLASRYPWLLSHSSDSHAA
jgi:hypothetical protein